MVLGLLLPLFWLSVGHAAGWSTAYEFFEDSNAGDEELRLQPVKLSDVEFGKAFFGAHWTSHVLCGLKRMPNPNPNIDKLADVFENGKLTQWNFPGYRRREFHGAASWSYTFEFTNDEALLGSGELRTLNLSLGDGNDTLIIQAYRLEQTDELVFVYQDDYLRRRHFGCSGKRVGVYSQEPTS